MADTRKLAAIMTIDVVGYSRLMSEDESGTASAVREHLNAIRPLVAERRGRIFKTMGDGALSEFQSVVEAVECAIAIQKLMAERNPTGRIVYRIGIHIGDVLMDGEDLIGEGVNIAARLESICEPGAILMSSSAYEHVVGRVQVDFVDLGAQSLKNIPRSVRAFQIIADQHQDKRPESIGIWPPFHNALSIAVLPFVNLSGNREHEYIADGIADEVITSLSRFPQFLVASRNSSFSFKDRSSDAKQVGRSLGVNYIVEGTVRSVSNRMRVSIELVDTKNGAILLGERFDGEVHDAFELQDIIAQRVIGSIAPRLEQADIDRARRKGPSDIEAYDLFLQSLPHYHSLTPDGLRICLGLLRRAITLDPKFAITKAFASMCIQQRDSQGTTSQESSELEEGISFAREALIAGHDDPRVLMLAGQALAYLARDWDTSVAALDRALQINSFSSQTWKASGWVRLFAGDPHTAIDHLRKSISLSPRDPGVTFVLLGLGVGHMMLKRYEVSLQFGQQAMWESPKNTGTYRVIAASLALLGRTDDARRAINDLLATAPHSSMELVKRRIPYRDDEFVKRYHDALRMAGMPENSA